MRPRPICMMFAAVSRQSCQARQDGKAAVLASALVQPSPMHMSKCGFASAPNPHPHSATRNGFKKSLSALPFSSESAVVFNEPDQLCGVGESINHDVDSRLSPSLALSNRLGVLCMRGSRSEKLGAGSREFGG